MAKFNASLKGTNKTVNHAGGSAYILKDKIKLVTQVATTFVNESKYYGDNTDEIVENIRKVAVQDPVFVANLAVYARRVFHLRSISHVMVGELANVVKGHSIVRKAVDGVIQRADDITEILSYYINTHGKPIPNSVKKGIAESFKRFDEYGLAKYNRKKALTLKDALCLTRPSPIDQNQADMWKRLIEGKLKTPKTWETTLSTKGNTKESWDELILDNRLGYMAALRNLRNIINSESEHIDRVLSKLKDPDEVRKSKQLPFRFLSAYRQLQNVGDPFTQAKVLDAIESALEESASNLPRLKGRTFFTTDVSGSMYSHLSGRGSIRYVDVGALLMALAHKYTDEAITSVFAQCFAVVPLSQRDSVMTNVQKILNTDVGHATYLKKAIEYLIENKIHVDRIVVFSDMQCYGEDGYWSDGRTVQSLVDKYHREVNPDSKIHSIDLAGYGTSQVIGDKVNLVSGWSEKVLKFIGMFERGMDSLVKEIEQYRW